MILHIVAAALLYVGAGEAEDPPVPEPMWLVDIEEAPEPPEAHTPDNEAETEPPETEPPETEPPETEPPTPEDEDNTEEPASESIEPVESDIIALPAVVDAGPADAYLADAAVADAAVADAAVADAAVADAAVADASVSDAGGPESDAGGMDAMMVVQAGDAGAGDGGAALAEVMGQDAGVADGAVVATVLSTADAGSGYDGGAIVTRTEDKAAAEADWDAGAGAVAGAVTSPGRARDGGPGSASFGATSFDGPAQGNGGAPGAAPYPGSDADLLAYFPRGELVAVMVRFDRLRGTPWAQKTAAVLAPMPDYRALIGQRDVAITDLFDTLVISSSRPRDVTATTLVGHTAMSGPEVRRFLNHADVPVLWSTARGGPLGRRLRSGLLHPADRRVFLMPYPGWVVLSHPQYFGKLVEPAQGDIDMAMAPGTELPPWLAGMTGVEAESGVEAGPGLIVTIAGMLPPVYSAPYIGEIVTPQRLSLALEVAPKGFFVRGTMHFAGAGQASRFIATAKRAQRDSVSSRLGKLMLSRINAYHAVRGLSLKQNGDRVGFATSISIADALAMMDFAGRWSQSFFLSGSDTTKGPDKAPPPPAGKAQPPAGKPPPPAGKAPQPTPVHQPGN